MEKVPAILLTVFVSLPAFCEQMTEFEKATKDAPVASALKGLTDFEIRVTMNEELRKNFKIGEVRESVENRLRQANVVFQQKSTQGLDLNIEGYERNSVISWTVSLKLSEKVFLQRSREPQLVHAITWQKEARSSVHELRIRQTLDTAIETLLRDFIEEWLAANKKE